MVKVKGWVHLHHDGETVSFAPGSTLPEWAEPMVTAPDLVDQGPTEDPDRPRGNASRDEWAAYATSLGYDVDDDLGRDEIKALVDS